MEREASMRALFGVVSLLIVLAVVGTLVKKQLGTASQPVAPASPSASATVSEQSQQLQDRVRSDVTKALDQGAARSADAEK